MPLNAIESGHGFYSESDVAQTIEAQEDQHRRNILCMATGQGGAETSEDCAVNLTCNHESPLICAGFCQGASPTAGGIGYHEQVSPTIKAGESGTAQVPAVICVHGSQDPITNTDHANAVNRNNGLENCVCYPINSMVIGKDIKDGDRQTTGIGSDGEPCPTLQSAHHHAVAIAENIIGHAGPSIINSSTVRRLTPIECERLMGFPDNWTRIPWKGKPVEDCPDSPRYKACGNSMCVNVMRWIGMRIELVERKIKETE